MTVGTRSGDFGNFQRGNGGTSRTAPHSLRRAAQGPGPPQAAPLWPSARRLLFQSPSVYLLHDASAPLVPEL